MKSPATIFVHTMRCASNQNPRLPVSNAPSTWVPQRIYYILQPTPNAPTQKSQTRDVSSDARACRHHTRHMISTDGARDPKRLTCYMDQKAARGATIICMPHRDLWLQLLLMVGSYWPFVAPRLYDRACAGKLCQNRKRMQIEWAALWTTRVRLVWEEYGLVCLFAAPVIRQHTTWRLNAGRCARRWWLARVTVYTGQSQRNCLMARNNKRFAICAHSAHMMWR